MAHLTILDTASRKAYRVDTTDAVVGRDPNAAITLEGEAASVVSNRHARVYLTDGQWWVEDIGSRNGTFIAGRRLSAGDRYRLSIGDEFSLGSKGPRLRVTEAVGNLASTMDEPAPAVPMQTLMEPRVTSVHTTTPASGVARPHVRLLLRAGDGKRLVGQDADVIIGRSNDSTIRVEGDMALAVSRKHARVFYSGWKICIEDAGSRNGTWLNRKLVQGPTVLERGDVIEFGAGGPRLTVEDVALVAVDGGSRTNTEIPAQTGTRTGPFVSELPTPPMEQPARRANDKK
jgi:pSer/pThr/pTyr-binding forkhead associated (FHA) protein